MSGFCVLRRTPAQGERIEAEKGLGAVLRDFAGKWVATRDYEVIAAKDSLEALLAEIEKETADTTVLFVAEDEDIACFF